MYHSKKEPTEKTVGITLGSITLLLSTIVLKKNSNFPAFVFLFSLGIIFLILVQLKSPMLLPLKRVWLGFGEAVSKITNPFIMGLWFCTVIIPTSVLMKLITRDFMKLKIEPVRGSYWVVRPKENSQNSNFDHQF